MMVTFFPLTSEKVCVFVVVNLHGFPLKKKLNAQDAVAASMPLARFHGLDDRSLVQRT